MVVEWCIVVPAKKERTLPLSYYVKDEKEAWTLCQAFVMDNDIHYDIFQNIWHMHLTKEQETVLTLMLPPNLKLKRLTMNY